MSPRLLHLILSFVSDSYYLLLLLHGEPTFHGRYAVKMLLTHPRRTNRVVCKTTFLRFFSTKKITNVCFYVFWVVAHVFSNTALSLRRTVRLRPLRLVPSKCLARQQQTKTCTQCCSVTIRPRQSSSLVSNLYIQLYFTNICGSTT